jgi:acetyltransferase-like isoleucine patch superfamily enzyme
MPFALLESLPEFLRAALRETFNSLCRSLGLPRMLYGWRRADGTWLAHTRLHSSNVLQSPQRLQLQDHVYIGPFNLIDASADLHIHEGVQITSHCAILTHSSHHALRVAGRAYWGAADPPAFVRAATHIGAYSFIGPHSVVAPGSRIGRGVLVRAHSYVSGQVPDFAIVGGQPARVIGDTRKVDEAWLAQHPECRADHAQWVQAP